MQAPTRGAGHNEPMAWTTADIPDQSGRTAVVTGANTGLGLQTATALAGRGARTVLACRDVGKAATAADAIRAEHPDAVVEVLALDLSDLATIRAAASELRDRVDRIDLLINNAGVMTPPLTRTADGFELQFGTNHLGHFAFSGLLHDLLPDSPDSRVVTVSSAGHRFGRMDWSDLQWERSYNRLAAYGRSKLANLLFTYELARRLTMAGASVVAAAAHPGASDTELTRHVPGYGLAPVRAVVDLGAKVVAQPPFMGALPTLRAATGHDVQAGAYFGPSGPFESRGHPVLVRSNGRSHDAADARRLWEVSESLTGVHWLSG